MFAPSDDDGKTIRLEELPLGIAIKERRPDHAILWIRGLDGIERRIEVTAFPLFAHEDEFVGAIAIFWERPEVVRARIWGCRGRSPRPARRRSATAATRRALRCRGTTGTSSCWTPVPERARWARP